MHKNEEICLFIHNFIRASKNLRMSQRFRFIYFIPKHMRLCIWRTCFQWHFLTLVPTLLQCHTFRSGLVKVQSSRFKSYGVLVIYISHFKYFKTNILNHIFDLFVYVFIFRISPRVPSVSRHSLCSVEKKMCHLKMIKLKFHFVACNHMKI